MVTGATDTTAARPKRGKLRTNVNDPVGDMLTRIRNANYAPDDDGVHRAFRVRLKYGRGRERTITGLKRISKPGRRVYAKRDGLPRVLGGLGVAIISTSQGLMTDRDASRKGVGGEVLAHVW